VGRAAGLRGGLGPLSASFDICGPLPAGATVLEASAGTGKTYTIAALATRWVAEGIPLERLLLVTFTRMATGELRERVRDRLVSAERGLDRPTGDGDPLVRLLADAPPDAVRRRRDRLRRALADFDAATIATTHGFCQEVLGGLGIVADVDPDATLVEDIDELLQEVVDDLYVRRFHRGDPPQFGRGQAAQIARAAVQNPATPIVPARGDVPGMRRNLALAVRDELERRKRRVGVITYDDLLLRLDEVLSGAGGEAAVARLRERYGIVLVDEFQDTDPTQWSIVRRAFGDGRTTLVLIGDPKQAIYAFRGADVYAYLDAARAAGEHATLDVNWRSDQALIDAYDALFAGARLGHPGIVHRRVRAARPDAPPLPGAALRIRVVHRDEPGIELTRRGFVRNAAAREHIAADLAADLVRLLSSADAAVEPGDVAVLVRTNRNAAEVRAALEAVRIPAVINGAGSVFGTHAAREWLRLLEAIERPASRVRAHTAALTCFFGWPAERVAAAEEDAWEAVHARLHDWGRVLRVQGVAALTETVTRLERLPERILAAADGERRLTDLRHVAQLLHAAAATEQLGTTALTAWLRRRIAEADQDVNDEERSRRLESDAAAVQVLTIHRAKGLEFPIVYLPFLWEAGYDRGGAQPVAFHDPDAGDTRRLDVALEGPDFERHRHQQLVELRGEDLRLAYVALTRARHRAVLWWAGSFDSRNSPLGRLLFARDADGNVAPEGAATPDDGAAVARFDALAAAAPGCIAVERSSLALPTAWAPPLPAPVDLVAARFDRGLDASWRRTSYTGITAGVHEANVASEPEEDVVTDERATAAPVPAGAPAAAATVPVPLDGMPAGTQVGTLVHRVLEAADFAAGDLDAELAAVLAAAQARHQVDVGEPVAALAGVRSAIETPLGPELGGIRLRDVARADRLDELGFELPLAGGDDPSGRVALDAIAALLRTHLPAGDPLASYAERLEDPILRPELRGYLTGILDLVVRLPSPPTPRFAVLDYKTNRLAAPDETLTAWHYRPEALAAEMRRAHYGLQALLYTAALHRYLRWRLPGYDPERHLAGVGYLFLRGMTGPPGSGVFAWRPPGALVEALSNVLDGT
jgi:exodeoxyribonuclease V beta subunit